MLVTLALALGVAPAIVTFPGPETSVGSPSSSARVFYVEMGSDEGGQNLSLRFDPGNGRAIILKRFDRSVDVGWSPAGRRFFVNDYIGSNIADCLIIRPDGRSVRGVSLMRIIVRSRSRPRETAGNSHFYVRCNEWISDSMIDGVVGGHTDEPVGSRSRLYSFRHRFRFDSTTGRIRWIESGMSGSDD